VFHEYVSAPLAVNVADEPEIIVGEFTLIARVELTLTVATAVLVEPLSVAVTVYDVLDEGETEIDEVVSPVFQEYVVDADPPVAVKVAVPPGQILSELTLIINVVLSVVTVTVATAVPVQPLEVPVTVYEVVDAGETVIGLFVSPVFHEYVLAPLAVNVADEPEVIVGELTEIFKFPLTVTVATAELVNPLSVAVTVYEVVAEGETEIDAVVSPVFQEYIVDEDPPVAVKVAVPPGQILSELTLIINVVLSVVTVTVATTVPVQPFDVPVTV
jgi:hypothetical protein